MTLLQEPGFFKIAFRDILEIIVLVGLGVGFLLSREGNASAQTAQLYSMNKNIESLTADVKVLTIDQARVQVVEDRIKNDEQRTDRLEGAIYGTGGLNEKFTDVQSKLTLIANLLEGKKK